MEEKVFNEKSIQSFDDVMEIVGKNGHFQKRFNLLFNLGLVSCISMANINIILVMSIPNHWCNVPGREFTNFSLEEWKSINIPKESDSKLEDHRQYVKCKMYNKNNISQITDCIHGYEYDKTWFKETVPSSQNWVCDQSLKVSNTFAVMRIADVLGAFIFGQLGDIIGRRPIFIISLLLIVIGNLLFTITSTNYILFLLAAFLAGFTSYTAYQAPLVIGMEISREKDKAYIAMLQNIGRTIGLSILPPILWFMGYWKLFIVISTLPCLIFFLPFKYIIESPRWLHSKNKIVKSIGTLKKIAKVNNKNSLPEDAAYILRSNLEKKDTVYGALGLFSNWRMSKNTICLIVCWIVSFTSYLVITLNISNLDGNPFLNFVFQGAVELPAILLGKYLSDKIGRRWTNVGSFFVMFLGCIPTIFAVKNAESEWMIVGCVVFLKFSVMLSYYVVGLQSVEMYPTCLRQTGVAIGSLSASAFGILTPYIVYLGTSSDERYPYVIIGGLSLIAILCGVILPETKLNSPDTLEEAKKFGRDQKVFQLLHTTDLSS